MPLTPRRSQRHSQVDEKKLDDEKTARTTTLRSNRKLSASSDIENPRSTKRNTRASSVSDDESATSSIGSARMTRSRKSIIAAPKVGLIEEDSEESTEVNNTRAVSKSPSVSQSTEKGVQLVTKDLIVKVRDVICSYKEPNNADELIIMEEESMKSTHNETDARKQIATEYKLVENIVTIISDDEFDNENGINEILSLQQIKMEPDSQIEETTTVDKNDQKLEIVSANNCVSNILQTSIDSTTKKQEMSPKSEDELISSQELLSDEMCSQSSDLHCQSILVDTEIESNFCPETKNMAASTEKNKFNAENYSMLSTDEFLKKIDQAIDDDFKNE